MCAVHHATRGHPDGREMFVKWSTADPPYADHGPDIRKRWASLDPDRDGFTIATLIMHVMDAGGDLSFLRPSAEEVFDALPPVHPSPPPRRNVQVNGRDHSEIIDDLVGAVVEQDEPRSLFRHGTIITKFVGRDTEGRPTLRDMHASRFHEVLVASARFSKVGKKDEASHAKLAQMDASLSLHRLVRSEHLPRLRGVVEHPVVRPDGSCVVAPGYDLATELMLATEGLHIDAPEHPSDVDVQRAVELLKQPFGDFPFDSEASLANTLAIVITFLARDLIGRDQVVPLFAVSATMPASGKTLLVRAVLMLVLGRAVGFTVLPDHDEEIRKKITSELLRGSQAVVFDNAKWKARGVPRPIESQSLEMVLTAPSWSDRRLQVNDVVELPNSAVYFITANNLWLSHELARRTVPIRLEPDTARPEERRASEFHIPELLPWLREHRGSLLGAAVTLVRRYVDAGCPPPGASVPTLGGFEPWCRFVGGTLAEAGVEGFLANLREAEAPTRAEWAEFLATWLGRLGAGYVRVRQVAEALQWPAPEGGEAEPREPRFADLVPTDFLTEPGQKGFNAELGRRLKEVAGQWFPLEDGGRIRVVQRSRKGGGGRSDWKVEGEPPHGE